MVAMKPLKRKDLLRHAEKRVSVSLLGGRLTERLNIPLGISCSEDLIRGRHFRSRTEMPPSFVFGILGSVFRTWGKGMLMDTIDRWVGPIKQKLEVKSKSIQEVQAEAMRGEDVRRC